MMSPAKIRRRRRMQSEESMRRKRHQRGSLQRAQQGSRFMWVVKYYDINGRRRQTALGTGRSNDQGGSSGRARAVHGDDQRGSRRALGSARSNLAVFGGLRPGEIFGLQRRHVQHNAVKTGGDRSRLGQLSGAAPHSCQLGARGRHRPDPSRPDGQRDRGQPGRIHCDRARPANGRRRAARSVSPSLMECWSVSPIGE